MIYDQPEILDQDIQLDHYDDLRNWHYLSSRMVVTKPRTSVLMVNSTFSSEYNERRGGRPGLSISVKLGRFQRRKPSLGNITRENARG